MPEAPHDPRLAQADKEALYALAAYALYFVWWYATAYGLGDGDPADYSYVCGVPAWFFYSCILGYPLGCLLVWLLTRCMHHMPLDADTGADVDRVTAPGADMGRIADAERATPTTAAAADAKTGRAAANATDGRTDATSRPDAAATSGTTAPKEPHA